MLGSPANAAVGHSKMIRLGERRYQEPNPRRFALLWSTAVFTSWLIMHALLIYGR